MTWKTEPMVTSAALIGVHLGVAHRAGSAPPLPLGSQMVCDELGPRQRAEVSRHAGPSGQGEQAERAAEGVLDQRAAAELGRLAAAR